MNLPQFFQFQIVLLVGASGLLSSCATVNFSANYYNPPANYKEEVAQNWQALKTRLPLKYNYSLGLIEGKESNKLNGIPAISNQTIHLPVDFIKYIYQNYYNERFKILTSVIAHELCHTEFNLASEPPKEHFKTDLAAIKLLGENEETVRIYYQSLTVMKNYWFARKGMAGHALNAGWNAINVASVMYGGPGFFGDLYGTDLNKRLSLIKKQYKLKRPLTFERSSEGDEKNLN